jgi:hypothetical protein
LWGILGCREQPRLMGRANNTGFNAQQFPLPLLSVHRAMYSCSIWTWIGHTAIELKRNTLKLILSIYKRTRQTKIIYSRASQVLWQA